MSMHAIHWAKLQKVGGPGPKCVLLILADCANDKGYAWPSRATIADKGEISIDTVDRYLARLVELGLVTKQKRFHGNTKVYTSSIYQLKLEPGEQRSPKRSSNGSRKLRPPGW